MDSISTDLLIQLLKGDSTDPSVHLLLYLILITGLVYVLISGLMKIPLFFKKHGNEGAKESASTTLYNHLSEQVREYRIIAESSMKERNDLVLRIASLELKAHDNDELKIMVSKLRNLLDEKDNQIKNLLDDFKEERSKFFDIISKKDAELDSSRTRISSLESSVQDLQYRLNNDEAKMLYGCPAKLAALELAQK